MSNQIQRINPKPFSLGDIVTCEIRGGYEVAVVTNIWRSDLAPSGWMVSCGGGQGIAESHRTGAMDSSQFRAA